MQSVNVRNGIKLSYQDRGHKSAPTIILIMGLGAQLTVWPDELYFGLVEEGFRVIRFDNRDVGQSSQLDEFGNPSLVKSWLSTRFPRRIKVPYLLEDMADDVLALMAALKIKKAHLVGASMGGMIGQILAAQHKKRVLSLTSIMSSSSSPKISGSNITVMLKLAKRPKSNAKEAAIQYHMKMSRLIGSPQYPVAEQELHKLATRNIERGYNPSGFKRQLAAITASGDRRKLAQKINVPTLVIHGSADPVIPLHAGIDTAKRIRKAKLKVVYGMGHDFPVPLMPKLTKWISKHVNKSHEKAQIKAQAKADQRREKQQNKAANLSLIK
ncbi:alpha/beta fold hydrolase [Thalassotalea euphylliae]|uniref:Alpha/beta fold hydrolase n=1 Tax=Thalassotalea euphylliae TaxID=1655234 RepID=A0A3E0TP77_9GAMM|nr:alpha/beta hydrolase [Thalassotalea euphylliae]REL26243.1 alpha/beta fold hydrolase [Thalassotalea euphylliae]